MKVPTLKGEKVILRPLSLKDAPNFCRWLKNRDLVRFLDMSGALSTPPGIKEERAWILSMQRSAVNAVFSIVADDETLIGSVALKDIDRVNLRAEFGIMIGDPRYWGQGYGTQAGKLILRYGFQKLKLNRIFLKVIAYNIRAQKSYRKLGFKEEGTLRRHVRQNGIFHNDIYMGILRQEFHTHK